jgi:hypothetical protein
MYESKESSMREGAEAGGGEYGSKDENVRKVDVKLSALPFRSNEGEVSGTAEKVGMPFVAAADFFLRLTTSFSERDFFEHRRERALKDRAGRRASIISNSDAPPATLSSPEGSVLM